MNEIIQHFLENRGFDFNDIEYLQNPNPKHQHNPLLLRGVDEWIDILHSVKGQNISVFPDYDADGVLSGTLVRVGLYILGFGDVFVYPPKVCDGYGLTPKSVDEILKDNPKTQVIITTDNGSNAHKGVLYAKEKGIKVLITDHHVTKFDSPADASVNPNGYLESYPFSEISGTAVIYKVLLAYILKYSKINQDFLSLMFLVGLSTIGDVMPLVDENRYFVKQGINMLNNFTNNNNTDNFDDTPVGQYYRGVYRLVKVLEKEGRLKYGITTDTFGFVIAPILNSPRRIIGRSEIAFDLFRMKKSDKDISQELYNINEDRKKYLRELNKEVSDFLEDKDPLDNLSMIISTDVGVAGLVAGSFTNRYNLPSIVFSVPTQDKEITKLSGSARSPEWFNLYDFLSKIDREYGLIEKWGGHRQASGLTIRADNFHKFKEIVSKEFISAMSDIEIYEGIDSEFIIDTEELKGMEYRGFLVDANGLIDVIEVLDKLKPFGQGFSKPRFTVVYTIDNVFYMGDKKQHIKIILSNGVNIIDWNGAKNYEVGQKYVSTGFLEVNNFRNRKNLQLISDVSYRVP